MLSDRRRRILTALVREYVESAHPVGSKSLVDHYDLDCSAATVRNDLAALEESGHVFQPHVSAGRVPTDVGYRAYVDGLREAPDTQGPSVADIESARTRLREVETELAGLMRETATLLTRLSSYAAVVLAPTLRRSRVRRVDLVALAERKVLVVLITQTGQIAKRMVELSENVDEAELTEIEATLNRALDGRLADEVRDATQDLIDAAPRASVWFAIVDELFLLLADADETSVFHGGTAALLEEPEFEDPEMVRAIVGLFEDGLLLAGAFAEASRAGDVLVRIGSENQLQELGQMSVVLAPYGRDGYLGLLGPTRMDYARAITSVRLVADTLSDAFGAPTG